MEFLINIIKKEEARYYEEIRNKEGPPKRQVEKNWQSRTTEDE